MASPGEDPLSQEAQHLPDSQSGGGDGDDASEKQGSEDNVSEAESETGNTAGNTKP